MVRPRSDRLDYQRRPCFLIYCLFAHYVIDGQLAKWKYYSTRRSVEHCTPHADGAPATFSLAYLNDKVLPVTNMSAKHGRGSISLHSPVTYQFETECKF